MFKMNTYFAMAPVVDLSGMRNFNADLQSKLDHYIKSWSLNKFLLDLVYLNKKNNFSFSYFLPPTLM